jgi:excisionase family DNA binding protein
MLSCDVATQQLTTTQAGDLVGVSQGAVRIAVLQGRLKGAKVGGVWYVEREELLEWRRHTRSVGPRCHQPWERVAAALGDYSSASADELSRLCDLHVGNVRKYLAILAKDRRVERLADGQWALIATSQHQGAA